MPNWREKISTLFGPGILAGITFGDWFNLLRANRFQVHPGCFPRAATISWVALSNSLVRWFEERRYSKEIESAAIQPPLFVLGHWRSGTTLLHDLLALDNRFAYPNLYQVMYPHAFLSTEMSGSKMFRLFSPKRRPQDNMRLDPAAAWEDEFIMCACGFRTPYLTWSFPKNASYYDQFLTFQHTQPDEINQWQATFRWFLKKLALKHGKPLILKSPTHTCRIKILLEMFPEAKFVHIHRDPYAIFQSMLHTHSKVLPTCRLQRADHVDWIERVIRQYNELHAAFFEQRSLIPVGQFHEVCFEELEKTPLDQMRTLYASLSLPDFSQVEPTLRQYVDSLSNYRKNTFPNLDPDLRQRISNEWQRSFDEWGYPRD